MRAAFPSGRSSSTSTRAVQLSARDQVGRQLWKLLESDVGNGSVLDLRELATG